MERHVCLALMLLLGLGVCVAPVIGAVGDHIDKIEISRTRNYKHTSGPTFYYQFDAAVLADDTVGSITMQAPGGGSHALVLEVEDGENWFNVHVSSLDEADLAEFVAGVYTFTVNYTAGGSDTTTVSYSLPGGTAIPPVTQQPSLSSPSDGAVDVWVIVTFAYESLLDPAWTVGLEWQAEGASVSALSGSVEGLLHTVDSYGPVALSAETYYGLDMSINHVVGGTNADGIPTTVDQDAEEHFTFTTGAGPSLAQVHRFWSPTKKRHFYTTSETEKQKLIDTYVHVWTFEGTAYFALSGDTEPDCLPVYRFWSDALSAHFYTISETEKTKLIDQYSDVWTYEGVAFHAFPDGLQPTEADAVYRFWSESQKCHFYTISESERDKLIDTYSHVWTYEGVAWYAYK